MVEARTYRSDSAEATQAFGAALGARLEAGHVLALVGEMGAGKTTLVRGLAQGLGVPPEEISSPTFALMNEYAGRVPVRHFDAWMAGREALFLEGGGAELLGQDAVALVEWADKVEEWLPRPHLWLHLAPVSLTQREWTLEVRMGPGDASGDYRAALEGLEPPGGVQEVAPKG